MNARGGEADQVLRGQHGRGDGTGRKRLNRSAHGRGLEGEGSSVRAHTVGRVARTRGSPSLRRVVDITDKPRQSWGTAEANATANVHLIAFRGGKRQLRGDTRGRHTI